MASLKQGFKIAVVMEKWKPIIGYENLYEVSSFGRVKSFRVDNNGVIIVATDNGRGYFGITLTKPGSPKKRVHVHRLVATAFLDNPLNLREVNHINAVRNDNRLENLEWCDRTYNVRHCINMGNRVYTERMRSSTITRNKSMGKKVINTITGEIYSSISDAATASGINYATLKDSVRNRRGIKNHTPFRILDAIVENKDAEARENGNDVSKHKKSF